MALRTLAIISRPSHYICLPLRLLYCYSLSVTRYYHYYSFLHTMSPSHNHQPWLTADTPILIPFIHRHDKYSTSNDIHMVTLELSSHDSTERESYYSNYHPIHDSSTPEWSPNHQSCHRHTQYSHHFDHQNHTIRHNRYLSTYLFHSTDVDYVSPLSPSIPMISYTPNWHQ